MMNKKGALVLRDMVFIMMMVSSIFILASLFVQDMAVNYSNDNMSSEWSGTGINQSSISSFYATTSDLNETAEGLQSESTGIFSFISTTVNSLKGVGKALFMVLTAPNTIADLTSTTLEGMGVSNLLISIIHTLILSLLWGVVIFTIISAFLRGGKL